MQTEGELEIPDHQCTTLPSTYYIEGRPAPWCTIRVSLAFFIGKWGHTISLYFQKLKSKVRIKFMDQFPRFTLVSHQHTKPNTSSCKSYFIFQLPFSLIGGWRVYVVMLIVVWSQAARQPSISLHSFLLLLSRPSLQTLEVQPTWFLVKTLADCWQDDNPKWFLSPDGRNISNSFYNFQSDAFQSVDCLVPLNLPDGLRKIINGHPSNCPPRIFLPGLQT